MIWAHLFCCKNNLHTLFCHKNYLCTFLSQKEFTHTFLSQKLFMHFFLSQKEFVVNTVYAFFSQKRFTHFFRKVFARWKLPSGKFRLFGPLHMGKVSKTFNDSDQVTEMLSDRQNNFRAFFVAKTISALRPESFCALKVAIRKVQTFWASALSGWKC